MADADPAAAGTRSLRGTAGLLGLLLFATYAYFMPAAAWNETSRFDLVRSLVERGRLDIDPFAHNTADKAFRAGHHYSDKAPGAALLAVPSYAAYYAYQRLSDGPLPQSIVRRDLASDGGAADEGVVMFNPAFRRAVYICNLTTNALAGAALGALFFLVISSWGAPRPQALAATLALTLGSLWFPYATMFYGHVLAGAFLFAAFALLLVPTSRRIAGAGALAGIAVLVEIPAALAAAALAAYLLTRSRSGERGKRLALFAAGAVPALVVLAAYHAAAFGGPFQTGYGHVVDPRFAEGMSRGFLGVGAPSPTALAALLFGRSRGLFYVTPVMALGLVGLWRALRAGPRRAELAAASAIVIAFLLLSAGYYMWWGGAALGPRHLIPALPFLALGIPFALPARSRVAWVAVGALLAFSLFNILLATAVSPLADFGPDVLLAHVYPQFFGGHVAILSGATNVGLLLGLPGRASLLPLLGLWGLGIKLLTAPGPLEPPPAAG